MSVRPGRVHPRAERATPGPLQKLPHSTDDIGLRPLLIDGDQRFQHTVADQFLKLSLDFS